MADITPNVPGGALPPKPAEAAKIQPKKETVRINLPPKPTAAPTIKLPTLPAGAPPPSSAATAAPAAAPASSHAPASAPRPPAPPASAGPRVATGPTAHSAAPRPAAATPAAAPRPMPVAAVATLTGLDKGLAIGAAVCSLIGLVAVLYLAFMVYQPAP